MDFFKFLPVHLSNIYAVGARRHLTEVIGFFLGLFQTMNQAWCTLGLL